MDAVRVGIIAAGLVAAVTDVPAGTRSQGTSATVVAVRLVRTATTAFALPAVTRTGLRAPGVKKLPAPTVSRTVSRPDQCGVTRSRTSPTRFRARSRITS